MRGWVALFLFGITLPFAAFAADRTPAPLPAEKAAKTSVLPDGFKMTVFAAEPDVTQPISFTIDAKGRIWVAEATNYGEWKATGKDRIVILEDRDGKVKRTLFYEGFNYITGLEVGFGGVWVMSPPCLYFVPDRNADDKPDGDPEVLFDGFGYKESRHNLANGFTWGPDGWLYGGHGRTSPSEVGRPGTPADKRIHCDGGVFRIHPTRLVYENFADGTTNPWGVDFDDFGACFVSNCVNPHLFHMLQGGHYEPWRNRPASLYAYERLPTIADHLHYPSGKPNEMRGETPEVLSMGGGHAHCGILIYRGGAFPREYDNAVFMCNVHGRRINTDYLSRKGSGYTASHGKDFMLSADPWFMGVTLRTGPDGSIFVSDWSDTGECHTYKPDRATGRIYKISHRDAKPEKTIDLSKLTDKELCERLIWGNDYYTSRARRLLQERATKPGWKGKEARAWLWDLTFATEIEEQGRLLGLWGLHVTGGVEAEDFQRLLAEPAGRGTEHVRAWVIQLLCEGGTPGDEFLARFHKMAKYDPSPVVRLALASALQRLPLEKRWPVATELLRHRDDRDDANLPLMYWYAVEPLVPADPARALALALSAEVPLVRQFIARRATDDAITKGDKGDFAPLVSALVLGSEEIQLDVLKGLREGIRGRKSLKMPDGWPAAYAKLSKSKDAATREHATAIALVFGDRTAMEDLRTIAKDTSAKPAERIAAMEALIDIRAADLDKLLFDQLADKATRRVAIRGLAAYSHPDTPKKLLAIYADLTTEEKLDAVATMASRKEYALALLDAVEAKKVSRTDISAFAARQMFALNDGPLTSRIKQVWGEIRETAADKQKQMAKYKPQLTPASLKNANLANGRLLFSKNCAQCHKLFGEGGSVGPDLTGTNRENLDYLLSNVIDPSAEVGRDFRMSVVRTTDSRIITGIVTERTPARLVIQTEKEKLIVAMEDVESMKDSALSIMPEGQLDKFTKEEIRDLIAYLGSKTQVALPPK